MRADALNAANIAYDDSLVHTLAVYEGIDFGPLRGRLQDLMEQLPPIEIDVISFVVRGKSEAAIGKILGMTQAGVSYRLRRAKERMLWLLRRPPRPSLEDVEAWVLTRHATDPRRISAAVLTMADTCNHKVASQRHGVPMSTLRYWTALAGDLEGAIGDYVRYSQGTHLGSEVVLPQWVAARERKVPAVTPGHRAV